MFVQDSRHIDQKADRLNRLGVVHQCALKRDARVVNTGLIADAMSAMNRFSQFLFVMKDLLMSSEDFKIAI